ncbi:MAG: S8 family serine peptidase [Bdellovibrionales bacterium]|jgi:subtilisin family serine protease|nr:S8 family serine peptidase [Bdellovibrionales bacterium]
MIKFSRSLIFILIFSSVGLFAQEKNQVNWGLNPALKSSINIGDTRSNLIAKKEVLVAVVDTGVDYQHSLIKNNLLENMGSKNASKYNYGRDFSKNSQNILMPIDDHGHGTHIAGIIKSVHPEVKIISLKYYNKKASESDNLNSTIEALEYAITLGVDIINYSSGGAGASLAELRVLKKAQSKGILVVTAAGNWGTNIDNENQHYYPASYKLKNTISVINHDINLKLNSTSNFGPLTTDISAPGTRIKSSLPKNRMGYLSGTSQATAFVSGVAAMLKSQFPFITPIQIKDIIIKSAQQVPKLKNICKAEGILDAKSALSLAKKIYGRKIAANE